MLATPLPQPLSFLICRLPKPSPNLLFKTCVCLTYQCNKYRFINVIQLVMLGETGKVLHIASAKIYACVPDQFPNGTRPALENARTCFLFMMNASVIRSVQHEYKFVFDCKYCLLFCCNNGRDTCLLGRLSGAALEC